MSSPEIIEAVGSEVESDQIGREIYGNERLVCRRSQRRILHQHHPFAGDYLHDMGKQDVGFVAVWLNYRF
jgi:hypothetical protein